MKKWIQWNSRVDYDYMFDLKKGHESDLIHNFLSWEVYANLHIGRGNM